MNLRVSIESAISLVFPRVCEFCGERFAGPQESFICGSCRARPRAVEYIREPYCAFCGLPYEGELTTEFV